MLTRQLRQQAGDLHADAPQFNAVALGEFVQHGRAPCGQYGMHLPVIKLGSLAFHQPLAHQAIHQPHGTVVADVQARCQLTDGRRFTSRKPSDGQQRLMLLRNWRGRIGRHDTAVARHNGYPLVDAQDKLVGIITRGDIFRALENKVDETTTLLQAGSRHLEVAYPDESLHAAVEKILRRNVGRLPLVDPRDPDKLVGYLGRTPILNARQRRLSEESEVEAGWLDRTLRKPHKP